MKKLFTILILLSLSNCSNQIVTTSQDNIEISSKSNQKFFKDLAKYNIWKVEITARNWDMSAKLYKISAREIERDGRAYWAYYFKSPFKRNVLMVIPDGGTFEIREPLYNNELLERDIRIDSDRAVKLAEEKGLRFFPILNMTLENRANYPEWELETKQGIYRINALDGSIKSMEDKK
ncbi:MAG: hypothetical protein KatS3mg002_1657 [Candidatus Woesearchaeota archaeon]|nr:MAG: hypothetical protein KatS3mg002_1657 [Candidatus Woesearchaeota archaeon]